MKGREEKAKTKRELNWDAHSWFVVCLVLLPSLNSVVLRAPHLDNHIDHLAESKSASSLSDRLANWAAVTTRAAPLLRQAREKTRRMERHSSRQREH